MKPQFTPLQLARQAQVAHEERLNTATTVINILMSMPFIHILFPGALQVAAMALTWANMAVQANRKKIQAEEQKALNATKKVLLAEKDSLLKEISKYDASTIQVASHSKATPSDLPTNIAALPTIKESRVADGGITKKRVIDTSLIKPTNIMLGALNR